MLVRGSEWKKPSFWWANNTGMTKLSESLIYSFLHKQGEVFEGIICSINFPQMQGPHPWTQVFQTEMFQTHFRAYMGPNYWETLRKNLPHSQGWHPWGTNFPTEKFFDLVHFCNFLKLFSPCPKLLRTVSEQPVKYDSKRLANVIILVIYNNNNNNKGTVRIIIET